jgi:uncharacterized protein YcbK (DUF882 family)
MLKLMLHSCLILAAFTTLSCSADDKGTDKKKAVEESPATGVGEERTPVCYLIGCYDPVSTDGLAKTYPDYAYPNPNDFNDDNLRHLYHKPVGILDLRKINGATMIAPNFRVQDFMSEAKGRYGLFSSHVVSQLQKLRNFVNSPVFVTSGYRSPGYNRRTDGSATWSRHTYGDAVDFHVSGKKIKQLTVLCEKYGASFTLTYSSHIHCDWRNVPGDLGFYDKRMTPDSQFTIAEIVAQKSKILVRELPDERIFYAYVALEDDEHDEGDLTYRWVVAWPDGRSMEVTTPQLHLPKNSGPVSIWVEIGGSIYMSRTFKW